MTRPRVTHRTQTRNVAAGCVRPNRSHMLQTVCVFDHEMFARIRTRAIVEGTSFAEQVRVLCEWGLEAEGAADD